MAPISSALTAALETRVSILQTAATPPVSFPFNSVRNHFAEPNSAFPENVSALSSFDGTVSIYVPFITTVFKIENNFFLSGRGSAIVATTDVSETALKTSLFCSVFSHPPFFQYRDHIPFGASCYRHGSHEVRRTFLQLCSRFHQFSLQ